MVIAAVYVGVNLIADILSILLHPASEDGDLVMSVIEPGQPPPHRRASAGWSPAW